MGRGTAPADILFIGEAPGQNEDEQGRPFVGPAGTILDRAIRSSIAGRSYYITNVVACVIPSTPVRVPSSCSVGYRRYYEGPVVTIETARGHRLTVTPNHPILTGRGWIAAGRLDERRDVVFSQDLGTGCHPNVQHMPPSAEEVFASLYEPGILSRVVGRPMDFHGDGSDREIQVVRTNGELLYELDFKSFEKLLGGGFRPSDTPERRGRRFGSGSRPSFSFTAGDLSGRSHTGRSSQRFSFFEGELTESEFQSFGCRSSFDLPGNKSSQYGGLAEPEFLAHLRGGHPGFVKTDHVVSIRLSEFSGHVYNFSTPEEWYLAGNIITHNCRPPGNRNPTSSEAFKCAPRIDQIVASVKPWVVILLGAQPLDHILGLGPLSAYRGQHLHWEQHLLTCVVTHHPASILYDRSPEKMAELREDIEYAVELVEILEMVLF